MYKLILCCLLVGCVSVEDPLPLLTTKPTQGTRIQPFSLHPNYSEFEEKSKSDLSSLLPKETAQGDLNSCSAFAVGNTFEYIYRHRYGKTFNSSKLFLYYNSRVDKNKDDGAELKDAILSLMNDGITTNKYWPYDISAYKTKPPEDAYTSAKNYKAYKAYLVQPSDIRKALSNGYPVIVNCLIYKPFPLLNQDNFTVTMPSSRDKPIGDHAMIIVGHDNKTQLYLINNSWGIDWGLNGVCYAPYEYINSRKITGECWIIEYVE